MKPAKFHFQRVGARMVSAKKMAEFLHMVRELDMAIYHNIVQTFPSVRRNVAIHEVVTQHRVFWYADRGYIWLSQQITNVAMYVVNPSNSQTTRMILSRTPYNTLDCVWLLYAGTSTPLGVLGYNGTEHTCYNLDGNLIATYKTVDFAYASRMAKYHLTLHK